MLYVTTRNQYDAFTAPRTLQSDRAPDGGFYAPFRLPRVENPEILALKDQSFSQCVAQILNLFFSCKLTAWDVEMSIGRYPMQVIPMSHRMMVAETWHNPQWDYSRMEKNLFARLRGSEDVDAPAVSWAAIAIRIAVLFGIYGELQRSCGVRPEAPVDVAVPTGDFAAPMAAWYAREMGLPIANILCVCNENSAVWELLHHGEVRTDVPAIHTATPLADIPVPENLEHLIAGTLGAEEAQRYGAICGKGGTYAPYSGRLERLRRGMYAAVTSDARLEGLIPSVYRTVGYILGPYTALVYSGLLDYRAKTGETRPALLLSDRSPICDGGMVASALDISQPQLAKLLRMD
ncbi:MAG: hypothetical protein LUJ09_00975 [Firmicutes bacterium]|nr:hypothetical protein [Bacillota bacterium]